MIPQNAMPHKPTLGWALAAVIVLVLVYHFTMGKR